VERRCQNRSNGNAVNTSNLPLNLADRITGRGIHGHFSAQVTCQSEFRIVDYD
jgi:hypothetical protein